MVKEGRLISWVCADAATNMAVDEALYLSYRQGDTPPTLRFYGWDPPAISVGKFQDVSKELCQKSCRRMNIQWVRRPTGGRAVLHEFELTYALVFGEADGCGRSVLESYFSIAQGLVAGLEQLGIHAEIHQGRSESQAQLAEACFAAPSWHEITVNNRKLVGSAQLRGAGAVLQHGSVLTDFTPGRLLAALGRAPTSALCRCLESRVTSCRAVLGRVIKPKELIPPITGGLSDAMNIRFVPGDLTAREWRVAKQLMKNKYTFAQNNERSRAGVARKEEQVWNN